MKKNNFSKLRKNAIIMALSVILIITLLIPDMRISVFASTEEIPSADNNQLSTTDRSHILLRYF